MQIFWQSAFPLRTSLSKLMCALITRLFCAVTRFMVLEYTAIKAHLCMFGAMQMLVGMVPPPGLVEVLLHNVEIPNLVLNQQFVKQVD